MVESAALSRKNDLRMKLQARCQRFHQVAWITAMMQRLREIPHERDRHFAQEDADGDVQTRDECSGAGAGGLGRRAKKRAKAKRNNRAPGCVRHNESKSTERGPNGRTGT